MLVGTGLDRVHKLFDQKAHRLQGVVVAGDDDVDVVRVTVGVQETDDDDAHLAGLADRVAFTGRVDHDHGTGHAIHLADAAQVPGDLAKLAVDLRDLLLGELLLLDGLLVDGFELRQALQSAADDAEVGQRAADPTLGDDRHAGALTGVLDNALDLTLGSNPEDRLALRSDLEQQVLGSEKALDGLAEVDHMDHSATAVDVGGHLRIPPRHAASEVHASFNELLCVDITHGVLETGGSPVAKRDGRKRAEECTRGLLKVQLSRILPLGRVSPVETLLARSPGLQCVVIGWRRRPTGAPAPPPVTLP